MVWSKLAVTDRIISSQPIGQKVYFLWDYPWLALGLWVTSCSYFFVLFISHLHPYSQNELTLFIFACVSFCLPVLTSLFLHYRRWFRWWAWIASEISASATTHTASFPPIVTKVSKVLPIIGLTILCICLWIKDGEFNWFKLYAKMFQEFILVSDQIPRWIALAYTQLETSFLFPTKWMSSTTIIGLHITGRYRIWLSYAVNATAAIKLHLKPASIAIY